MLSPDNILMFRCDIKKANWYINRNLAHIIKDDPLTIKLNFKPNGMGNHNKEYGLSEMMNVCVNCGSKDNLTRHHVVPICYRKYFPIEIKSHNFHDVLPMCVNCHELYERKADDLKKNLDKDYNAPINGKSTIIKISKFIKMAKTLINDNISLPNSRIIDLRKRIKRQFGIKRLTKSKLIEISKIKVKSNRISHGKIVIDKIENLQLFVEMWRKHFIDNNSCDFLPKKWDIKNKI